MAQGNFLFSQQITGNIPASCRIKGWELTTILILFFFGGYAQQNYLDFEGGGHQVSFAFSTGNLDTAFANPGPDSLYYDGDSCLQYIRADAVMYDNIRWYPHRRLIDVDDYASGINSKKIKMMLFSRDSIGTEINLQLGNKGINIYPDGVYSEYSAFTTKQNEWEEVTFNYDGRPSGSQVSSEEVDKIVLLFKPNSLTGDTFYMAELTGPELDTSSVGTVQEESGMIFYLGQNYPNPVKDNALIHYHISRKGMVVIKLYNLLGQEVLTLINEEQYPGAHQAIVDVSSLPNGAYYYVLKAGEHSAVKQMIIAE